MNLLRSVDIFERYIGFSYKTKTRYRTYCGGLCTLAIAILMLVFLILIIMRQTDDGTYTVEGSTGSSISIDGDAGVVIDVRKLDYPTSVELDPTIYEPWDNGYGLGFLFSIGYDPTMIILDMYQFQIDQNGNYIPSYFPMTT